MIKGFRDKNTKKLWSRKYPSAFSQELCEKAYLKLLIINAANTLEDLRNPPGNHLEKLRGNRQGQYSIKIDGQWRICFTWHNGNADHVEICDYH